MSIRKLGIIVLFSVISLFSWHNVYADQQDDDSSDDDVVTVPAHSKDAIGNMLLQSVSLMGIPYRWGGNTPETGMDCSGFIRYVFKKSLGITLPRTAAEMSKLGKRVSINNLEPGDLLFFNTRRGANTHIGIYIGNNKFIQAPHTGTNIQVTEFSGHWRATFNGAKRIVQENEDEEGNTVVESYQEIRDEALPGGYRRVKKHYHHVRRTHKGKVAARKVKKVKITKHKVRAKSHVKAKRRSKR